MGLADAGIDVRITDLFLGTSTGSSVAAQVASGLPLEDFSQRQVDPAVQAQELPASPNSPHLLVELTRLFVDGSDR
jgi:NTE family protein